MATRKVRTGEGGRTQLTLVGIPVDEQAANMPPPPGPLARPSTPPLGSGLSQGLAGLGLCLTMAGRTPGPGAETPRSEDEWGVTSPDHGEAQFEHWLPPVSVARRIAELGLRLAPLGTTARPPSPPWRLVMLIGAAADTS